MAPRGRRKCTAAAPPVDTGGHGFMLGGFPAGDLAEGDAMNNTGVYQCTRCKVVQILEPRPQMACKHCKSGDLFVLSFEPEHSKLQNLATGGSDQVARLDVKEAGARFGLVKPTVEQLQASKVGLRDAKTGARYANPKMLSARGENEAWDKATAKLPVRTDPAVADIVRCIANNVKIKSFPNVRLGFPLYFPYRKADEMVYLPGRYTIDLSLPLDEMAKGKCRPTEHARANTSWGNVNNDLPSKIGGMRVNYLEFGWKFPVPASKFVSRGPKHAPKQVLLVEKASGAAYDDMGDLNFVAKRVREEASVIDPGLRFVVSDCGHLFFTHDHYRTFFLYDPTADDEKGKWKPYKERKNAGASWYDRGRSASPLPVSSSWWW
jgi:hypothetical protein